jgi:hypothetical protein
LDIGQWCSIIIHENLSRTELIKRRDTVLYRGQFCIYFWELIQPSDSYRKLFKVQVVVPNKHYTQCQVPIFSKFFAWVHKMNAQWRGILVSSHYSSPKLLSGLLLNLISGACAKPLKDNFILVRIFLT